MNSPTKAVNSSQARFKPFNKQHAPFQPEDLKLQSVNRSEKGKNHSFTIKNREFHLGCI